MSLERKLHHVKKALLWPNLFVPMLLLLLLVSETQNQGLAAPQQEGLLFSIPGMEMQSGVKSCRTPTCQMVHRRFLSGWKTVIAAAKVSESTSDVESEATVYHLDYSSPKTHPPKNN